MIRVVLAAVLAVASGRASATDLTANQIARDIQDEGPHVVVQRLWDSGAYDHILNSIAEGDGTWIALAPQLATGADAGASEGLTVAMAEALPKNPRAVLSVLDPGITALAPARVCGVPFIEDTVPDVRDYINRAESAVSGVGIAALQSAKAACLAALRTS